MAGLEAVLHRIPGVLTPEIVVRPNRYAESPFTPHIVEAELPQKFAMLSFKLYDGTMDLEEHVTVYKQRMLATKTLIKIREVYTCHTFGTSLAGSALQWYVSLSTGTISSFIEHTKHSTIVLELLKR